MKSANCQCRICASSCVRDFRLRPRSDERRGDVVGEKKERVGENEERPVVESSLDVSLVGLIRPAEKCPVCVTCPDVWGGRIELIFGASPLMSSLFLTLFSSPMSRRQAEQRAEQKEGEGEGKGKERKRNGMEELDAEDLRKA